LGPQLPDHLVSVLRPSERGIYFGKFDRVAGAPRRSRTTGIADGGGAQWVSTGPDSEASGRRSLVDNELLAQPRSPGPRCVISGDTFEPRLRSRVASSRAALLKSYCLDTVPAETAVEPVYEWISTPYGGCVLRRNTAMIIILPYIPLTINTYIWRDERSVCHTTRTTSTRIALSPRRRTNASSAVPSPRRTLIPVSVSVVASSRTGRNHSNSRHWNFLRWMLSHHQQRRG